MKIIKLPKKLTHDAIFAKLSKEKYNILFVPVHQKAEAYEALLMFANHGIYSKIQLNSEMWVIKALDRSILIQV